MHPYAMGITASPMTDVTRSSQAHMMIIRSIIIVIVMITGITKMIVSSDGYLNSSGSAIGHPRTKWHCPSSCVAYFSPTKSIAISVGPSGGSD
jgi:hypothetical protein